MKQYDVTITFTREILGGVPKDRNVYASYIASKAALTDEELAEELATIEVVEEKGWTGFHMRDGKPFLCDYVIKGFFKDACKMMRRVRGSASAKLRAYKQVIDGLVFVEPREIVLELPDGAEMAVLERPLRAQTAQGERVTLARSDTCPPGTKARFTVTILDGVSEQLLREWLDYGAMRGIRRWRNAGYGTFVYEYVERAELAA